VHASRSRARGADTTTTVTGATHTRSFATISQCAPRDGQLSDRS
jgi:hypothetical protein